uniref:Uncharacterized protein n=1 Tax=Trichogramma kaykai TaxID=54128 RepID=A0ABD2XNJ8_9HYME
MPVHPKKRPARQMHHVGLHGLSRVHDQALPDLRSRTMRSAEALLFRRLLKNEKEKKTRRKGFFDLVFSRTEDRRFARPRTASEECESAVVVHVCVSAAAATLASCKHKLLSLIIRTRSPTHTQQQQQCQKLQQKLQQQQQREMLPRVGARIAL